MPNMYTVHVYYNQAAIDGSTEEERAAHAKVSFLSALPYSIGKEALDSLTITTLWSEAIPLFERIMEYPLMARVSADIPLFEPPGQP